MNGKSNDGECLETIEVSHGDAVVKFTQAVASPIGTTQMGSYVKSGTDQPSFFPSVEIEEGLLRSREIEQEVLDMIDNDPFPG